MVSSLLATDSSSNLFKRPAMRRLITPLVLLLATLLFAGKTSVVAHGEATTSGLHPVILLPGLSCSQFDARLTNEYEPPTPEPGCGVTKQGPGWFRLWENYTALQEDPSLLPCYQDQIRVVYDRAAGDYRNAPGVETRIVSFGTTRSFYFDDPAQKLVDALQGVGYREGANLFGAPYDFRYAPAPPGVAARSFSDFSRSLRHLVEQASRRNGNRPAILVTHSYGGVCAIEFLQQSPLPWRRRYIKHFVMLGAGVDGSPIFLQIFANTTGNRSLPPTTLLESVLLFGNRSFASLISLMPSPKVYGDEALVITPAMNYSAENVLEFLAAVGFSDEEVERYRVRALTNFRGPVVPMTSINGVGVPTIDKLVYSDGNFTENPQVANCDGDGIINLKSMLALERFIGGDPDQRYFKSILIPNMTHGSLISNDFAFKIVVNVILEANRATS